MSDLDELERLAKEAQRVWFSNVPLPELRAYHDASRPETVLALVARVREAEAVIAEVKQLAEAIMYDRDAGPAREAILAALARYESGGTDE